ncbi:MAG: carbon storage regulator [Planctomycetota bacterium]
MLVLSRKQNQSIVIDGQIEIEILKTKGNTVRLGIRAPQHVKVLRGEISPFPLPSETKTAELEVQIDEENLANRSLDNSLLIARAV